DDAREGGLLAELYLLHLEELEGRPDRLRRPAARLARVLPAEPLREHARHPARVPPAGRPARVRGPAPPGGDDLAELRDLFRLRELRERARTRGVRGVHELGEVRGEGTEARRRAAPPRQAA